MTFCPVFLSTRLSCSASSQAAPAPVFFDADRIAALHAGEALLGCGSRFVADCARAVAGLRSVRAGRTGAAGFGDVARVVGDAEQHDQHFERHARPENNQEGHKRADNHEC